MARALPETKSWQHGKVPNLAGASQVLFWAVLQSLGLWQAPAGCLGEACRALLQEIASPTGRSVLLRDLKVVLQAIKERPPPGSSSHSSGVELYFFPLSCVLLPWQRTVGSPALGSLLSWRHSGSVAPATSRVHFGRPPF